MKGTTIWKGRMKTTSAHCLMRMVGNVVHVGRRHERSLHINVTHREGTHGEPKGVASLVVTNQYFWCGSTHTSKETTSKHMTAAEKHNRCVVDAGRFHYPVIDIPPDTICPSCDLIFNDTAELQRHLASMEYPLPEGHSLVINAETLWQCLWKRDLAKDPRQMESKTGQKGRRKHIKSQAGGSKDDVTMLSTSLGQKGYAKGANKSTDAKLHNAVFKTHCVLSQQVREVRGAVFMC